MIYLRALIPMIGMRAFVGAANQGDARYYHFPEDVPAASMSNFIMFGSRWEYFGERAAGDSSFDLPQRAQGDHLMQALEDGFYINVVRDLCNDLIGYPPPNAKKYLLETGETLTVPKGRSLVLISGTLDIAHPLRDIAEAPFIINARNSHARVGAVTKCIVFELWF